MNGFAESPGPSARSNVVYRRLHAWLSRPRADWYLCLLAFVLLLPSLDTGLAADDFLQAVMLQRPSQLPGFERAPLDIFRFCDPRHFRSLLDQGVFTWWDDPNTVLAFMRPLSAATHVLDHALFRNNGAVLHFHSALWALCLFLGLRALYRALIPERWVANLALALYALDDARGWLVSWVAARNAAIATALSVWVLVAHIHYRNHALRRTIPWALFVLALLAGEGSLAITGYLFGYALFLDTGSWRRRLGSLAPYALIVVVWRVVYRALGYGASGSSLYIDPISDPAAFLGALAKHAPTLLGSQFGGMWADVTTILFVSAPIKIVVYSATWLFILWMLAQLRPLLQSSPLARFAGLGALLALAPACLVAPTFDRMLTWVAIGASIVLAQLIAPVLSARAHAPAATRATVGFLVGAYLIGALLLPSRSRGNLVMRDTLDRAATAVPRDPSVADKTLIWVNPPFLPYAGYLPIERAGQGLPRPRAQHILAIATTPLHLQRVDPYTLRLRPRGGFLLDPLSKLLWSERRPFRTGERIVQGDLTVTVLDVGPDRRPLEIEARFEHVLEDPRYLWVDWQGTHTSRFKPPRVGSRSVLAGADYIQSVLGVEFPFALRL